LIDVQFLWDIGTDLFIIPIPIKQKTTETNGRSQPKIWISK